MAGELPPAEASCSQAATHDVPVVSICITCKTADGILVGPDLFEAVKAAADRMGADVQLRRVQCLSVCKRPTTVAVSSSGGYTFLFGDLQVEAADDLLSFVQAYQGADYGLVPWRQRAEVLRKGIVARIPPSRWSPDDGSAPK
ncbi:DUF1636 domain-containing protein [Bradyrhizobium lablabi]|nr:DUF1636 domain-containing protein [Bradyrhizobium lablabi]